LAQQLDETIQFVGMAGHDSVDEMQAFVDEHGLGDFPHVVSQDGSLWQRFEIPYQPGWVVLDADGNVVLRSVRPDEQQLRDALDQVAQG
jgi:hypothetical protein